MSGNRMQYQSLPARYMWYDVKYIHNIKPTPVNGFENGSIIKSVLRLDMWYNEGHIWSLITYIILGFSTISVVLTLLVARKKHIFTINQIFQWYVSAHTHRRYWFTWLHFEHLESLLFYWISYWLIPCIRKCTDELNYSNANNFLFAEYTSYTITGLCERAYLAAHSPPKPLSSRYNRRLFIQRRKHAYHIYLDLF